MGRYGEGGLERNLGRPIKIKIIPLVEEGRFQFRLDFRRGGRTESTVFELPTAGAMGLAAALQLLARQHNIPTLPPKARGKPDLKIVT